MEKISVQGLASLMENKTFSNLKLENIEVIKIYERPADIDFTYEIAFTNIETNELFICEYTFECKFQGELWYSSIYKNDLEEYSDVPVYKAELIYVPKFKKI